MQAVIRFIHEHYYDIFIPVTALALLRLAMLRPAEAHRRHPPEEGRLP